MDLEKNPIGQNSIDESVQRGRTKRLAPFLPDPSPTLPSSTTHHHPRWTRFKAELKRRTLNTTPSFFVINMGTGITSILLHDLPYQFKGLKVISNVVFGLNVVLFLLFLGFSLAKYLIWPTTFKTMIVHPSQSLFLGTFSMGFTTIIGMCALSCVPAWGEGMMVFTWVIWWINLVLTLFIAIGVPFAQFTRHGVESSQVTGAWLLPAVSPLVFASAGAFVAEVLPPQHARLTLQLSYMLWGAGFPVAFIVLTLYYGRLSFSKIPPASVIYTAFIPIAPLGQGAFVLLRLSKVARDLTYSTGVPPFGGNELYSMESARIMADALVGGTIPIALVLWGMAFFWFVMAFAVILDMALVTSIPFSISWWSCTFPIGVWATATTQFASELDSKAFKVVGMILSLLVTLFWLLLIPVTLYKLGDGTLFLAPDLVPKAQEQSQDRSKEDRGKSVSTTRKYSFTASRRSFSLGPGSPLRGRRSRSRGVGEKMSQRDRSRET